MLYTDKYSCLGVEDYGHFKTERAFIKNMFRYFCTVLKNMIFIFSVGVILITMGHYLVIVNSSV